MKKYILILNFILIFNFVLMSSTFDGTKASIQKTPRTGNIAVVNDILLNIRNLIDVVNNLGNTNIGLRSITVDKFTDIGLFTQLNAPTYFYDNTFTQTGNGITFTSGILGLGENLTISDTELGYLNNVTSNLQDQLNSIQLNDDTSPTLGGQLDFNGYGCTVATLNISDTELSFLNNATSNLQDQLNNIKSNAGIWDTYAGGTIAYTVGNVAIGQTTAEDSFVVNGTVKINKTLEVSDTITATTFDGNIKTTKITDLQEPIGVEYSATAGSHYLILTALYDFDIDSAAFVTDNGECTFSISINGTDVTGLTDVNATSSIQGQSSSNLYSVSQNDYVQLIVTDSSGSAEILYGEIYITRK